MLKSYLLVAWRNVLRHKVFSLINIIGLSIGMIAVMLIYFYVQSERSFDKFSPTAIGFIAFRYRIMKMVRQSAVITVCDFFQGTESLLDRTTKSKIWKISGSAKKGLLFRDDLF